MKKSRPLITALSAIILILILSLVDCYFILTKNSGDIARIYRDKELLYEIDLGQITEPYDLVIEYNGGEYNKVEVRPGSVGITEATCPDKLCVNMGFIRTSSVPVTCLPHHLVITIESKGSNDGPDAVAK